MDASSEQVSTYAISRRAFLAGMTTTGLSLAMEGAGAEPRTASAASTFSAQPARAIDIHHHYTPPEILVEAKNHADTLGLEVTETSDGDTVVTFVGARRRDFRPDISPMSERMEMMRDGRLAMAAIEAQTSGVGYVLSPEKGEDWARLYNEGIMGLVRQQPQRFIGLAVVPMQDPPRAAKVLEDAIINQKMSGALITSNVNGTYYSGRDFDPFWDKAQELDVLIVMHPNDVAGAERYTQYGLLTVCGNPADSSLSIGHLVYGGVFDRFPNLKVCVFHGGGFFPYHLGRFDRNFVRDEGATVESVSPPSAYLKNLYFDTLVYNPDTLDYLRRLASAEHLLLGTDYPFDLGDWHGVDKVEALDCPDAEKEAILQGNARRLLKNLT
jgi:aminocarboxymuconate-semialdehyde decarboxylase